MIINYEYIETESAEIIPEGDGWVYWGDRITPEEQVAVWRRDADVYGETEVPQ